MFNTKNQIKKLIKQSKNVLLHLHPSPDGDSAGSSLAMMFALKQLKKNITVISGDSEPPQFLSCLPGFEEIKNQNIQSTDLTKFDLFLILDSSSRNQISKQEFKFPASLKTINIDHHISNEKFADINFIDGKTPATCQILFDLFKTFKIKIDKNIAACLFAGIYTDTGGFKYIRTTDKTFNIAAELSKIYPEFTDLIFELENQNQPDRLKFLSIMLNSIENYFSDHVAIASISFDEIRKNQINSSTINNSEIPNTLKSVIGWDVGISLIEYQENMTKISMRTRDSKKYDLSKICTATGFGGGHAAAAGAAIPKSLEESKKMVLNIIKKLHPQLGKP